MDRFGYYKTGNLKFYSRLEAFETAKRLGTGKVEWHFNEEVFSSYDWTIEPTETLDELYKQRAQQLRDKYDYLVLFYSGGADSTNVLNSFIDNGIKLDEVVNKVNYDGLKTKDNAMNGEIFHVAIPKIAEAQQIQPELKHTVIDLVDAVSTVCKESETKFNWIYEQNTFVGVISLATRYIKESQKHWRDLVAEGKTIGFIHGIDKPSVTGSPEKGFYAYFFDLVDSAVSPYMQINNEDSKGFYSELFYWSPDAVKILIKQGHVLKRILNTIDTSSDWVEFARVNSTVSSTRDKKLFFLKLNAVNRAIYSKWERVGWQVKPTSTITGARSDFYHKLSDWEEEKWWWKMGVAKMWEVMPAERRKSPTDMYAGYKPMHSKYYYLGK